MDKILEMLGIQNLDESKQTEIKEKLNTIVETKVLEGVKEKEKEIKEDLTEEYEEKFTKYKEQITEQFSNFVDEVLDEEMKLPEKIVEYARLGEMYQPLIEEFKTKLAVDEGHIDEEVKGLLKESKEEIEKLKEQVNSITSKKNEAEHDAKEFASNIYIREKCEGLDLKKAERVMSLLEGITDRTEIDKKFDVIVESMDSNSEENLNEEEAGKGKTETKGKENLNEENLDDPFNKMKQFWASNL